MSDHEKLKKLRNGDERVLMELYKSHFHKATSIILRQGGGIEEAEDIFQEALIVFWQNCQKPDFQLSSKIGTYLFSVCRNLWTKELSRKSRLIYEEAEKSEEMPTDRMEQVEIIRESVANMSETCRKVLTLFYFDGMKMDVIASKLGYATTDAAKTQKYKCKKKLDAYIRSRFTSEDFQEL